MQTLSALPWPKPADTAAAARLLERFAEQGPAAAALAAEPGGTAMLAAIGGGSPFLSDLLVREHAFVVRAAAAGPDAALDEALATLARTGPAASRAAVCRALRVAKRQVALLTAMADIGGAWPLGRVTATLSAFAEAALRLACGHLLRAAHAAGQLHLSDPADPEAGSGLIVLAMGKLGAAELNYSSDIDLILLYDPDAHPRTPPDTLGPAFTRIARNLVTIMEARDADGYVFRTDLRLRPDPAATPPCVALPAAIAYYESLGENWERAAMTKARPIAGDIGRGEDFLRAIRPFVWRRGLDFAAIADIHAMKRRIDEHRGLAPFASLAGFDVKLGPGGIREIEFAAQTLQLVWGGRDPALRNRTTLGALRRLARAGHVSRREAAELSVAYRFLRAVEHRLQMVADRQTHALPEKPDELERFAAFLGCRDVAALELVLRGQLQRVRARYAAIFGPVTGPAAGTEPGTEPIDLSGPDLDPATAGRLRAMGFANVAGLVGTLRGWRAGRVRALRSGRARELMDAVLPRLLAALADQADPDTAFARFDAMLGRLPAGVPLLSTFDRNPALLDRVAAVLGAAPSLADHLASVPTALEGLLEPPHALAPDPIGLLSRRLAPAATVEDTVLATSATVRAAEFRLCCAEMEGLVDADAAGRERTALADAALAALLPAVRREHERRYGTIRGGDVAVVALGKAGSREMMAGSDLDLMLLYVHPPGAAESRGGKPLPPSQWFIRLAHAFVAALTAPGRDGPLYAVDMRLRPSGNKGPVAVSLSAFARYHAEEAWTWERMALTRARVVAGRPAIRARAARAIAAALSGPWAVPPDPARILADAADMRRRLARDLPHAGQWDAKLRPGGGMEVEFIAQALLLATGVPPGTQRTADALAVLAARGALDEGEAEALRRADLLWRTVQGMLRIVVGKGRAPGPASLAPVLRAAASVAGPLLDEAALHATLDRTARIVRDIFNRRIGVVE